MTEKTLEVMKMETNPYDLICLEYDLTAKKVTWMIQKKKAANHDEMLNYEICSYACNFLMIK